MEPIYKGYMSPQEFKSIRRRLKRTQTQFAEDLGKGMRTVQDYEHGRYSIPAHVIKIINKLLAIKELTKLFDKCKRQNDRDGVESYPHKETPPEMT